MHKSISDSLIAWMQHYQQRSVGNLCRALLILTLALLTTLCAITAAPITANAQGGGTHTVHDGDTLTSIATRYHTTIEALIAVNKLKDGDSIYVGQVLKLPGSAPQGAANVPSGPPSAPGTYTVRPGDTLIGIAGQYGVSVDQLLAANKLKDPSLVQIGLVLKIPDARSAGGTANSISAGVAPFPDGEQTLSAAGGPAISFKIANGRLISLSIQTVSTGKQALPLSCEAKIASQIAFMYGLGFDEMGFLARLPHTLNPRTGFVGSVSGRFYWPRDLIGGNATGPGGYGVHVEGWAPVFQALSGFQTRLLSSVPATAATQIDTALRHGQPVAVWAVLGFRENIAKNSVWLGPLADGTAIDCGGPAPECHYLVSGEHAYLIIGRDGNSYQVYDPGKGEINLVQRNTVINGITAYFAFPTGSAPGAVIIPSAERLPDLSRLPGW